MFRVIVTIKPDADCIHCGRCICVRGDGFNAFCWMFNHAPLEHDDGTWRSHACLEAEKSATTAVI